MATVDLLITLRRLGGEQVSADATLIVPGQGEANLANGVPVVLDQETLLELANDQCAYGKALFRALFADESMVRALAAARLKVLHDGLLRLRLRFEQGAYDLNGLRWETLRDPVSGAPLAQDQNALLSRQLPSARLSAVRPRARRQLWALVVVAGPSDIEKYGLTAIMVEQEIARLVAALAGIRTSVIARTRGKPATLDAIKAALDKSPDIVCLVCHGSQGRGGDTTLFLEKPDGTTCPVSGLELSQEVGLVKRRPSLMVLATCESAGEGADRGALTAVGPSLSQVGVPAVIAMQGRLTVEAAAALLPALFQELLAHGEVDLALATARSLMPEAQRWVPALWLRSADGRLWTKPRFSLSTWLQLIILVVGMLTLAVLTGSLWWENRPRPLEPMGQGFNVVAAGIGVDDGSGRAVGDVRVGRELSDLLYRRLSAFPELGNLRGWRTFEGAPQGVGFITGTAPERYEQAGRLAEQLEADVVLYGYIVEGGPGERSVYYPEIYVSEQAKAESIFGEEILGSGQMGAYISFDPEIDRGAEVEEVAARIDSLGHFLNALEYYYANRLDPARESLCRSLGGDDDDPCAVLATPDAFTMPPQAAAVASVFLGAIEGRQSPDDPGRSLIYLEWANARWPEYARPYLSKGAVLYRRALALAREGGRPSVVRAEPQAICFDGTPDLAATQEALAALALRCYQEALAAPVQPPRADIALKARLSIGNLALMQVAFADDSEALWQTAITELDAVIEAHQEASPADRERLERFAGYAYGSRAAVVLCYPNFYAPAVKPLEDYQIAARYYSEALRLIPSEGDQNPALAFRRELAKVEAYLATVAAGAPETGVPCAQ